MQNRIVAKSLQHPVQVPEFVQVLCGGTRIRDLDNVVLGHVDPKVRERALPGSGAADLAPRVEVSKVVIVENIEDNVFGRMRLFDNFHPFVRLIDAVASDAEVFNGLPQVSC